MRATVTRIMLTALCLLSVWTTTGQESVTKSGTVVTPADRVAAMPALWQKGATPLPDPTAGTYLVVTREDLRTALEPLLQWKREQGYRVETIVMQSRESDSIRAALQARYDGATVMRPAQKYVLLVGDVDRLKACQGRYAPGGLDNHVTDLYYGEYTGDYIPEALVGRLSVADSAELATVVEKTIAYEQGRWAAAERMLLTAGHEERNNAVTTTNGQVHYLAEMVAEHRPELDTICFYNPASGNQLDTIVQALDYPNALINYTAHCTRQGWNSPAVGYNTLDTLEGAVPTVWVNNCCLSNAFGTTCFGERLLRKADGGAVAVIGATNETLWNEDYYWAVGAKYPPTPNPTYESERPGAFDRILIGDTGLSGKFGTASIPPDRYNPDAMALGAMNYAGCSAVTLVGSPYDAFYWEIYTLLGDPSMSLMLGSHDTLELDAVLGFGLGSIDSIEAGATGVEVWSSPWSRVNATQEGKLLGTTLTNDDGHGIIYFNQGLTGDSLTLTATRPESIFKQLTLPIVTPTEGRLAVTEMAMNPSNSGLVLKIENVGSSIAIGHRLTLSQDSTNRDLGAALEGGDQRVPLIPLPSGEGLWITVPLGEYTIGQTPMLSGRLTLSDNSDEEYSALDFSIEMTDLRPQLTQWQVLDMDSVPVNRILPERDYLIVARLAHEADTAKLIINDERETFGLGTSEMIVPYRTRATTKRLHIELSVSKDRWQEHYEGWLLLHDNMEDFESGDWSNYPWQSTNLYPWQIDSTTVHSGEFSARSAPIGDAQRSTMTLKIETLTDDSVTFYYNVSSEGSDWLYFFVDGRRRGYWSGNSGWQYHAVALSAGKHTLQWIYQKDASGSEREDCAHIDDIRLPLALWNQPYGHAEEDSVDVGFGSELGDDSNFDIWPNPAREQVTISHGSKPYGRIVTVYDAYGRKVDEIKIEDNCKTTQYFTHHLRFGIYTLVLHDKDGRLVRKLIVTK